MSAIVNCYLDAISVTTSMNELDALVNRAANDETISNAEYEFIYGETMNRVREG